MSNHALFVLASVALATSLLGAESSWTGQITDGMCEKDHSMMASGGKQPDPKDCTLACVKSGSKFVFVSNGTTYQIANQDLPDLKTYAGSTVKLTGDLESDGKTIKAEKLTPAK
jgi:hypothetical protein